MTAVWTLIGVGVLGGLITGVSPCVLPILPVLFFAGGSLSAADTRHRPLPNITGLILSFSVVTLLGSLLLSGIGLPQNVLRWAGLIVLLVIGLSLIVPKLEEIIQKPFYRLPKLKSMGGGSGFVLGLGLGTLYVPCAGPVLAAITIAGATGQVGLQVVALTAAFAVGASVPLLIFALAGDRIGRRVAAYQSSARRFRVGGGVVMIALAVALAVNATDAVQRVVPNYTAGLQSSVEDNAAARGALSDLSATTTAPSDSAAPRSTTAASSAASSAADLGAPIALANCPSGKAILVNCGPAPTISGITTWFNSVGNQPLTLESLRGKVVLVDFWTYSCINYQRALPHVASLSATYRDAGLQVIGVHTPEFAFEKEAGNVQQGIADLGVKYPVAMDNSGSTWRSFSNRFWPAAYLIDATGVIRHVQFGEGGYQTTEQQIRQLLRAANPGVTLPAEVEKAG